MPHEYIGIRAARLLQVGRCGWRQRLQCCGKPRVDDFHVRYRLEGQGVKLRRQVTFTENQDFAPVGIHGHRFCVPGPAGIAIADCPRNLRPRCAGVEIGFLQRIEHSVCVPAVVVADIANHQPGLTIQFERGEVLPVDVSGALDRERRDVCAVSPGGKQNRIIAIVVD